MLVLENVSLSFGGLKAISDLSLQVGEGENCQHYRAERGGQIDRHQPRHRDLQTRYGQHSL